LRLTLAFVLAMALLLAVAGTFLYVRLGTTLDEQIDSALRTRADDVAALVRGGSRIGGTRLAESDESFAQVLGPGGEVRDATPGVGSSPLLTPDELGRARGETIVVEHGTVRLLATPVDQLVVVAGASLDDRHDALAALRTQLLLGGPLLLLLASLAGYALAAATLRPVLTRLEAGLERERRFVAEASHELRTPLSLLKATRARAAPGSQSRGAARRARLSGRGDRPARAAAEDLPSSAWDEGRCGCARRRSRPRAARAVARRSPPPVARSRSTPAPSQSPATGCG
jgi:signal transduction histidine kinase